jgi:hypothetical protein
MTLDNMNWREKILDALAREQSAVPGRAGETPLSDLAAEFSQLSVSRQPEVVAAITGLVIQPDIESMGGDGKEYWSGLSFLTKYLSNVEKEALRSAFQTKLFDHEMRKSRLSVYALHGFIAARGRLSPDQWRSLVEIQQYAPVAWLGAAAMSGMFDFARQTALQMLKDDKLDLRSFLLGMDAWSKVWDERGNFKRLMEQFRDAVPSSKGKEKFTKWLERRGYLDEPIGSASTACITSLNKFKEKLSQATPSWQVENQNLYHPA